MKLVVCSVFDVKASAFSNPFFVPNENIARRSFGDAVLNPETGIAKHVSDYKLYKIADWDDNSGEFSNIRQVFLANASDFISKPSEVKSGQDKEK